MKKLNTQIVSDKIRGCLIGGAAGDALGYPVEFMSDEQLFADCGSEGITEYCLTDGTALFSDDTQMTLFSANGILNAITDRCQTNSTKKLEKYIYQAYIDWLETQGFQDRYHPERTKATWLCNFHELYSRRAPGHTCISALLSGKVGRVDKAINNSKGCGGIMRAAPFGLIGSFTAEAAFEEACNAAAITHGHPLGFFPAGALAYIIHKHVFDDLSLRNAAMDFTAFAKRYRTEYMNDLIAWIGLALDVSKNDRSDVENIAAFDTVGNGHNGGATGESALYIALYSALRYEDDFDKAIICAVNRGEDRDSTGAVTGNLIGAITGYSHIADKWKQNLELRDLILQVADDLACLYPKIGDLNDTWLRKYYCNHK